MTMHPMARWTAAGFAALLLIGIGCAKPAIPPAATAPATKATSPDEVLPAAWAGKELPIRMIPNIPRSAEAYYAPDNLHVIAQTKDPTAEAGKVSASLTYTYTDTGEELTRINDRGQDACSWFLPDGTGLIWTSTRDNLDMPPGNWSEETDYPQGAELYLSDLKGGNIKRLTNNKHYEAEVTTSLDGKWVFFTRQIDGRLDIWKMRIDGTDVQPRTFTKDMNWAPFMAPDGKHFFYDRIFAGNNWEVVMNDLAGGEPVQITYNKSFDGFASVSWDGKKLLFARSLGTGFMSDIHTFVMDISSLGVGPEHFTGSIPPRAKRPADWVEDPGLKEYGQRLGT